MSTNAKKLYNRHDDKVEIHRVLAVIEFNSNRKRMSVVVEDADGRRMLLTKGADTTMFPRLEGAPASVR
jgi:magnesium-transporting ATPase (P-type)